MEIFELLSASGRRDRDADRLARRFDPESARERRLERLCDVFHPRCRIRDFARQKAVTRNRPHRTLFVTPDDAQPCPNARSQPTWTRHGCLFAVPGAAFGGPDGSNRSGDANAVTGASAVERKLSRSIQIECRYSAACARRYVTESAKNQPG
jgi:hypothetical protein